MSRAARAARDGELTPAELRRQEPKELPHREGTYEALREQIDEEIALEARERTDGPDSATTREDQA